MKKKIYKFGGSSICSSKQFYKIKAILSKEVCQKIVVVSALGKRYKSDTKITDDLISLYKQISNHKNFVPLWGKIANRFLSIEKELNIDSNLKIYLKDIYERICKNCVSFDYLVSRGEFLTAKLLSAFLKYEFIDAKDIFYFDKNHNLNLSKSRQKSEHLNLKNKNIVVPGFYGTDNSKNITLFSRGGSDVSAGILSNILNVHKYENWTDVSGVFNANPKLVNTAHTIENLSYNQLQLLSFYGATVVHEDTLKYIQYKHTKLYVKNTNSPNATYSVISEKTICKYKILGITSQDIYKYEISIKEYSKYINFVSVNQKYIVESGLKYQSVVLYSKRQLSFENKKVKENQLSMLVVIANKKQNYNKVISFCNFQFEHISISDNSKICKIFVGKKQTKKTTQILYNSFFKSDK